MSDKRKTESFSSGVVKRDKGKGAALNRRGEKAGTVVTNTAPPETAPRGNDRKTGGGTNDGGAGSR